MDAKEDKHDGAEAGAAGAGEGGEGEGGEGSGSKDDDGSTLDKLKGLDDKKDAMKDKVSDSMDSKKAVKG